MTTTTYVVDPLNIITMGLISGDPLNLITDGFITAIIEEEIIAGGGAPYDPHNPWQNQKKKKKITARVFIAGKEYVESVTVDDLTISISDIKLDVSTSLNEVKVKIILPEK